jgi:hypothetical protein
MECSADEAGTKKYALLSHSTTCTTELGPQPFEGPKQVHQNRLSIQSKEVLHSGPHKDQEDEQGENGLSMGPAGQCCPPLCGQDLRSVSLPLAPS